jgi:hypothetical protein
MNAVTEKPIKTTLDRAEQAELMRYKEDPASQFGVDRNSDFRRRKLVESLAGKGYLEKTGSAWGFDYYRLKGGSHE